MTVEAPPSRAGEFAIELLPQRLCISYAADDSETISLWPGEYQLIHRMLVESGHTETTAGVWA